MDSTEVKAFYDEFLESKMLEYRISGNLRIDRATERILDFVQSDDQVLDVGCGIGITAERIADNLKEGHIWAFDISERNIWYARETVDPSSVTFFVADVSEDEEQIREKIPVNIDVVTLVDVIEHIPQEGHKELFSFFRSIMSDRAFLILTYPSPQYQRYLKESDPDELQVIDQIIEREELLNNARSAGFSLRHYSLETVWKRNQYVHCVLQTDSSLGEPNSEAPGFLDRVQSRISSSLRPLRRWKYVDRVFK